MPSNDVPNPFHTAMLKMAVHDLRAPLSSMLTGIELALQPDLTPEETDRVLRLCLDSGGKLMRQVESMLDIAYMQEGRLIPRLQALPLRPVAESALAMLHHSINEMRLLVDLECPDDAPPCLIDPDLMQRVLVNLLDNAVHHSPIGQRIAIVVSRIDAQTIAVRVSDSGMGIPVERRESIFENDSPDPSSMAMRKRRGYGIGLVFCKVAIEAQGGTIRVEDAPPGLGGASFVVTLPTG